MRTIPGLEQLTIDYECKELIIFKFINCYVRVCEYSQDSESKGLLNPDEFLSLLTRTYFREEDHYIALKINAYCGDIKENEKFLSFTASEVRLCDYMMDVARDSNLGVMSVLYTFYLEHYMYRSTNDQKIKLKDIKELIFTKK